MLTAFFDAGLQKTPRPVFYVSGYVAFPGDWQVFNRTWRQMLRRNDLPYFHMTDYVARQEHYKGWSEAKRLAVMKRIVALASASPRLGMGAALLMDDFERLSEDDKQLIPDHPYGLCLIACIGKTARTLHRQGMADHVDYVFESGDTGQGGARIAVEELFANPTKRKQFAFNSLRFAPKEEFPGLQLADVLAFETGRYVPLALGLKTSPERKCFQALRERNEHYTMLFDFEELRKLAEKQRQRRDGAA